MNHHLPDINQAVLYIEDDQDTLIEMRTLLKRRFRKVIIAQNGSEALRKFNNFLPELVITDLRLPDMSGLDIIQTLRGDGFSGPVIITSAVDDITAVIRGVDLGIHKYLLKPFSTAVLDETLLQYVAILQQKSGDEPLSNPQIQAALEKELPFLFSTFLKTEAGKGPQSVSVTVKNNIIEIRAIETLTDFESVLLNGQQNTTLAEQNRRLFYQIKKREIEHIIEKLIDVSLVLTEIRIDVVNRYDLLIFTGQ